MAQLMTLETWAAKTYGTEAPSINTLRRWCREGFIRPAPQKHGRAYYVSPNARYDDYRKPNRAHNDAGGKRTLAERLSGGE